MYLEVVDSQGKKRQIPADRPRLLIGREPSCDVHLTHPAVSRRHAQLQLSDQGRWLLQDFSSRNRVYVDHKAVQQVFLEPRQVFRIADYRLYLVDPTQARLEPEAVTPVSADDDSSETGLILDGAWLDNLTNFQRTLASLDEGQQVLETLAREVRRLTKPQVVAVGIAHLGGYAWEVVQTATEGEPLAGKLEEADAVLADEPSSAITWPEKKKAASSNGGPTNLLIPLKGRQTIVGHVYINRPARDPLPEPLQHYLSLIAAYSGLAWENLHLGRLRQSQIDIEKELQHAREIQLELFPHTFEVDDRLDAFAVNLPSAKVSGDYYDIIRTGPNTVAFVIADAMGHGMPAALMMAAVRAGLRMGFSLSLPWAQVFHGLDDLIRQAKADTFVTGMVGLLDLAKSELLLVSAGHPAPSILVDGVPMAIPESCLTRPWGIDLETQWDVGRLKLKGKRWSILTYTDGVTDPAGRHQRGLGFKGLAQFHHKNFNLAAEDLCQGLLNEVSANAGQGPLGDDQTVLVLCSAQS